LDKDKQVELAIQYLEALQGDDTTDIAELKKRVQSTQIFIEHMIGINEGDGQS
jgi:hypothetical protein